MNKAFRIKDIRVFTLADSAKGGTYFKPDGDKHWLVDSLIANPMSGYAKYRDKRSTWGIGVLGALVVEIETEGGTSAWQPGRAGFRRPGWSSIISHAF